PTLGGYSVRNLKYMRALAGAWPDAEIVQQLAAQNKTQIIKNRNIKTKAVGQSAADFIIGTTVGRRFKLFVLAQVCLALSAAIPTTSNGSQALSENTTAQSDMTFPADGRWSPTGNLNTARDIHTATLLPNGLVLVAGG